MFVPVLFVGYLGIVFAKSLIRLSSGIVKIQVQAGGKKTTIKDSNESRLVIDYDW